MTITSANKNALHLGMRKTSIKEMIKTPGDAPAVGDDKNLRKGRSSLIGNEKNLHKGDDNLRKGDASIMEMKNLHKGDDNLRIGDASIMEMKKECAKETFAIAVKISAKEIPSELKAKSSTIVSRYCFSKHGLI